MPSNTPTIHGSHADDLALLTGCSTSATAVAPNVSVGCSPSPASCGASVSTPASSLQSYDLKSLPSSCNSQQSARTCSTAAAVTTTVATTGPPSSLGFATPVTAGNVLQELRLVEARVLEIATVLSRMELDVGGIERSMLKRILDSIVTTNTT